MLLVQCTVLPNQTVLPTKATEWVIDVEPAYGQNKLCSLMKRQGVEAVQKYRHKIFHT